MIFLITQRLIETEYGDKQECLDVNWYNFISKIKNVQLILKQEVYKSMMSMIVNQMKRKLMFPIKNKKQTVCFLPLRINIYSN